MDIPVFQSAYMIVSVVAFLAALSSNELHAFQPSVSYDTVTIINQFPHDPLAFTESYRVATYYSVSIQFPLS
ncbi:hypothetical protein Fmac_015991 [Flemingia macrophylla]|uniref:Uncharacterized protein n=1 Tax=Flemingia macrophylla TaxID=520843 RepID=A0ABD1MG47_9FABA